MARRRRGKAKTRILRITQEAYLSATPTAIARGVCDRIEVHDGNGRSIAVRRINALDRLRLLKAAGPELSQNDAWLNMAALAFSVTDINGTPRLTPTNEHHIEATIFELGDVGLEAIADALTTSEEATTLFDGPPEGNVEGTPN
jgi:hypothetical protein